MDPEIQWIHPAAHKVSSDYSRIYSWIMYYCYFLRSVTIRYGVLYICSIVIFGSVTTVYAVLLFVSEIINYFIFLVVYNSEPLD